MKQLIITCMVLLLFVLFLSRGYGEMKTEKIIHGNAGNGSGQVGFKIDGSEGKYEAIPSAITVDSAGHIYIADIANQRILKFNQRGKVIATIDLKIEKKKYYKIVDDLATDKTNNLYIASRHEMKILKYNRSKGFDMSIDLHNKQICWRDKNGWGDCAIQIENMSLDIEDNIYLSGTDELIKFSPKGLVLKKWTSQGHQPIYFLDEVGSLYLMTENRIWRKYDSHGNDLGSIECVPPYFKKNGNECDSARFVDKKGFTYFYEGTDTSNQIVRVDNKGNTVGTVAAHLFGNLVKFDRNGNIYSFDYKDNEFWVEKITWQ